VVSGQIDLNTGGEWAITMRKLIPLSDRACHHQNSKGVKEMRQRGRRTRGIEEAHPFAGMSQVNANAAGVDIGAEEIVVSVAGEENKQIVRAFDNYTVDLQNIGKWLKERNARTVAMESTGVYWIPLFEELERQGFECLLISSRLLRRVPGRKSDILDAQWI
jgi:transposase